MFNKTRSRKDRLSDILNRRDRGVGRRSGVVNVLSNLFINMLHDLGMTPAKWRHYMDDYVAGEVQQAANNNRRDRTSIRGNLNKEFIRHRMTWKVFCKAMAFLKLRSFRIVIMAMHQDYKVTEHSFLVDYSTADNPIPEEERAAFLRLRPDTELSSRVELREPPTAFTPFDPVTQDTGEVLSPEQEAKVAPKLQFDLFE
jgi:hypothetical protein